MLMHATIKNGAVTTSAHVKLNTPHTSGLIFCITKYGSDATDIIQIVIMNINQIVANSCSSALPIHSLYMPIILPIMADGMNFKNPRKYLNLIILPTLILCWRWQSRIQQFFLSETPWCQIPYVRDQKSQVSSVRCQLPTMQFRHLPIQTKVHQ